MESEHMRLIKSFLIICLLPLVLSCSQAGKEYSDISESLPMDEIEETSILKTQEKEDETNIKTEKESITNKLRIIKNANCRIKVSHVEKATLLSKEIVSKFKGYISNEYFTNTNYAKENRFTIRVPKENFDKVLDSICAIADFVDYKTITTKDVTEEYVDITSRLKTKLEVKQRYETILKTKANTVEDILLTEDNLRMLQEEIEVAQGRLNYLSNRVSYSTIQFEVYETVIPIEEPDVYQLSFLDRTKNAVSFGWNLLEYLVLIFFYIWPLCLLGAMFFIYFKWIKR
ncbi:DUF4349 domain-containing protein [uncultured Aquimarina sp.]|uniref:DUF4349 domain-containing protein n=1 Tax=uncultured Aquimarina sp. TaxID=575652 RepID=UPI002631D680|nr:DUF4349 domain-containing protein [uncultured Aquimarina sp.]